MSDTPEAVFGRELRRLREQSGLSLRELARRVSRSHSNLWDYERGHRLATPEVVADYESVLGLPAGTLSAALETARVEVYGLDRSRRRPYREPAGPASLAKARPAVPVPPPGAPRRGRPGGRLVGRESEVAELTRLTLEVAAGEFRLVDLLGPAGIGKSTLIAELMTTAAGSGFTVLTGGCPEGARVPYLPIVTALQPLLYRPVGAAGRSGPSALEDLLGASLPTGVDERWDVSAERSRLRLFCRATDTILEAAERGPLLLVVEDLHWADPATAALLEHLVITCAQRSVLSPLPLMIAVTTRAEGADGEAGLALRRIEREHGHRSVRLSGLNELGVTLLMHELTGAYASPPLLRAVTAASHGNPLMIRSLVRRLLDQGALSEDGRRLRLNDPAVFGGPLELDEELARQAAGAGPEGLALLEMAAVLNQGSLDELRAAMDVDRARFEDLLDVVEETGVMVDDGTDFGFSHPQVAHVIRRRLTPRRARRLHLQVAQRLERLWGSEADRHAPVLSHHLRAAGPDAPAGMVRRYGRVAADMAFAVGAWGDCAIHLDDVIAASDEGADGLEELQMRSALAHFRDHNVEVCCARLEELVTAARGRRDFRLWGRAATLLARSYNNSMAGDPNRPAALMEEFLAAEPPDPDLVSRAWAELANARFAQFDVKRGIEAVERAVGGADPSGPARDVDDEVRAEVYISAGIQQLALLRFADARSSFERSSAHAARLGDPWALSWGGSRLPLVQWAEGDLVGADQAAARAAEMAASHFDWAESALCLATRAGVAAAQGRFETASRLAQLGHQHSLRSDYIFAELLIAPTRAAVAVIQGETSAIDAAMEAMRACGLDPARFEQMAELLAGGTVVPGPSAFASRQSASLTIFDVLPLALEAEIGLAVADNEILKSTLPHLEYLQSTGMRMTIGWPSAVDRLLGACQAALGAVPAGAERLARCHAESSSAGSPLEAARCVLALSAVPGHDEAGASIPSPDRDSALSTLVELGAPRLARLAGGADT